MPPHPPRQNALQSSQCQKAMEPAHLIGIAAGAQNPITGNRRCQAPSPPIEALWPLHTTALQNRARIHWCQLSRKRSLDDCTAPVIQGALLQNSCMQRQAHRDRRRWRLKPAVSSDRLSRASSDSDAMHFARLQPFFSDCLYTPFFFQRARILSDSRSNIEILSDSRSNIDNYL